MSEMLPRHKLKALRIRAGWTVRSFAEAMGYGEKTSSYRTYEDTYKKANLPLRLIEMAAPLLVGRGEPPIELEEVWALAGVQPGKMTIDGYSRRDQAGNKFFSAEHATVVINEFDISPQARSGALIIDSCLSKEDSPTVASWSMPKEFLESFLFDTSGLAVIRVIGNSMEPDFFPGERVLIDTHHKELSHDGVYALWRCHGVVIKQLQLIPKASPRRVRIISVNSTYETDEVDIGDLQINGRVVGKWLWK